VSAASKKGGQRLWALFTDTPHIAEAERAAHYMAHHLARRDQHPIGSRPWHVERIKLDWWVRESLRISDGREARS
jgi:hypothetical protein